MTNTEYIDQYNLLPRHSHILCALSGGRDSVYLLYRLLDWARERNLTISAAHFNHCLRGEESERDAQFVANLCEELSVPLYTERGNVQDYAKENRMGVEEAARTLRYAFLERVSENISADYIATAHHADDLAETMLFHLARGAGSKGLSGIPPKRGNIIRPILMTTRAEIDQYIALHEIAYVEDSTNALDDCSRNVIRHKIIPVMNQLNPAFVRRAATTALLLREDDQCLQIQADEFLQSHPIELGIDGQQLLALPSAIYSRVIRTIWGEALSSDHVKQIMDLCKQGGLGYTHIPGAVVRYDRGRLWRDEPCDKLQECTLHGDCGTKKIGDFCVVWQKQAMHTEIHNSLNTFCLKCENIEGAVVVGEKRDGDRIKLAGSTCTKRLKQLFQEKKLTQPQRSSTLVFRDDLGPIAVYGFGTAQRCIPEIGDEVIYIRCKQYKKNGGQL